MAKIIIDIDDDRYEKLRSGKENYLDYQILLAKLNNAIVLPTNCTNGDVIKALFPNATFYNDTHGYGYIYSDVVRCAENYMMTYDKDWWNAPYDVKGR